MDLEIHPVKLLIYDPSLRSWRKLPSGDPIDGSSDSDFVSSRTLPPLVIATWNVWEDERFSEYRHPFILQKLFEDPLSRLDVITLQEVTPGFFDLLLAHPIVENEWLVTDLTQQLDICPNPYGTVILVRKSLLVQSGAYTCVARFHEFENTRMQRGLNFVELCSGSGSSTSRQPILRIGTSHFESHPEDKRKRREQFEVSAEILTSSESFFFDTSAGAEQPKTTAASAVVPAILTGDCNICSYEELVPLLKPSSESETSAFIDAFLAARPIQSNRSNASNDKSPFTSHPTFGVTFPSRKMFGKRKADALGPKRLDYVCVQGLLVKEGKSEAGFLGDEPVCERAEAEDEEGRDGRVYASDHLGVWVRVRPPNST